MARSGDARRVPRIALARCPGAVPGGGPAYRTTRRGGAGLFGHYLFTKFGFQNLYAETPTSYFEQFKSGAGKLFDIEGRLRSRAVVNGRREDLYILTFTRERWLTDGIRAVERCTRSLEAGRST